MWSERLKNFKENNKQLLDLKFELHMTIYIKEILKDCIDFSLHKTKTKENLIITFKNDKNETKELTSEEFFYWWQIDRFNEIISEEKKIFNEFNKIKDKVNKTIKNLNNSEENSIKNKDKIIKFDQQLKELANDYNLKLDELRKFRILLFSFESIEKLLKNIKLLIKNNL